MAQTIANTNRSPHLLAIDDDQVGAQRISSLLHAGQSHSFAGLCRVKTDSIVLNEDFQRIVLFRKRKAHVFGTTVFDDVADCFLHDTKKRGDVLCWDVKVNG